MMKITNLTPLSTIPEQEPSVLVLGYFDGLHLGHKALFDRARQVANDKQLPVLVLTFRETPQLVFQPFSPDLLKQLTAPAKRLEQFQAYGVDHLYLTDFTSSLAKRCAKQFIDDYITPLNPTTIVVGFDYRFGCDRYSAKDLKERFSGEVIIVSEQQQEGEKISSSRIRQAIKKGNVLAANQLLGYAFSTRGIVVHGDARGRTIGFPTANLALLDRTHLPSAGVYVTDVCIAGKLYRSMTSIGKNVTFGGVEERLEVHVFDFDKAIYGEQIEVFWLDKIREMVKFSQVQDLIEQLKIDRDYAQNWHQ